VATNIIATISVAKSCYSNHFQSKAKLRPESNAILQMSRTQLNQLGSCEVRRLTQLRWLNTVFDTCVSFTFFSKTLDPLVVKNGSKLVNNTNFGFLMVKLMYVPLPWQHE